MTSLERRVYSGLIKNINVNQIFVFGSNPEGRHGKGAAKIAKDKFGATYGKGRGLQGKSYGLITKNLRRNYHEKNTGILYQDTGPRSVSKIQITKNYTKLPKNIKTTIF